MLHAQVHHIQVSTSLYRNTGGFQNVNIMDFFFNLCKLNQVNWKIEGNLSSAALPDG